MNTKRFSLLAALIACSFLLSIGSSPAAHAQTAMHVSTVVIERSIVKPSNYYGYDALVTVVDESSNPVAGATVSGNFSGCFAKSASGITDGNGVARLVGAKVHCGSTCMVTVAVTGVVKTGLSYNASANGSSGASVAVSDCFKPCKKCYWKQGIGEAEATTSAFSSTTSPNPFSAYIMIRFSLEQPASTLIRIWTVSGDEVVVLKDADLDAGEHSLVWVGDDGNGAKVAPGTYFYSIESGEMIETGTIVVVR